MFTISVLFQLVRRVPLVPGDEIIRGGSFGAFEKAIVVGVNGCGGRGGGNH